MDEILGTATFLAVIAAAGFGIIVFMHYDTYLTHEEWLCTTIVTSAEVGGETICDQWTRKERRDK